MTFFYSSKKGYLDRRCCQKPANILLDVIKESVPKVHIAKPERANIISSFKDVYHKYCSNPKGDL